MFSFFSKKKSSPDDSPSDVIPGPISNADPSGDDFIMVDKKVPEERPEPVRTMYPPMPPMPSGMFGGYPPNPQVSGGNACQQQQQQSFMDGVPFEMSPQLCTKSAYESTQTQVDGILAYLTRQMSVDEAEDYTFRLERSVCEECY